jgi:hypothetical protein
VHQHQVGAVASGLRVEIQHFTRHVEAYVSRKGAKASGEHTSFINALPSIKLTGPCIPAIGAIALLMCFFASLRLCAIMLFLHIL